MIWCDGALLFSLHWPASCCPKLSWLLLFTPAWWWLFAPWLLLLLFTPPFSTAILAEELLLASQIHQPCTLPQQSSSETILEPIVMDVCCSTSHRRWSLEPTDHDDGWTLLPNNHQEKQHTADDDEDFETVGQGGFRAQCDLRKRLWFIFICLFAQRTALSLIPRLTTGGMERSDRPYSSLFNIWTNNIR